VNEASLKTLNEYIQSSDISGGRASGGQHVQFYQRHYQSDHISGLKKGKTLSYVHIFML